MAKSSMDLLPYEWVVPKVAHREKTRDVETDDTLQPTNDWASIPSGGSIMNEPYTAGPGLAVDPDAVSVANTPLYTITLFDGTVIGGKMAYQEQYALVVGGAYWIDGPEQGQFPDGCDLRIPYNAIKFWHMQV